MKKSRLLALLAGACLTANAGAATFSDTYIGWRYGTEFAEPFETNNISKNIFNLSNVSGYTYGTNFFNVDLLISDQKDPAGFNPATGTPQATGAQEAYVVYRNTAYFSKIFGQSFSYGPVRDVGIQAGFDWNTKKDAGYNSKKQMFVIGPDVSFDVPGFLDIALLELYESNAPYSDYTSSGIARYHYTPHPALSGAFGIGVGDLPLTFKGYFIWIAAKGKDEFGNDTQAETHFDVELMADMGKIVGPALSQLKLGIEYEYWQNKFGNNADGPAGSGAFAHTPMVRAEYHF